MAANKPQDKASAHADRLQKLIDSGWSPEMAREMLANDADVMEKSGPTSGSTSSDTSSDKTKTPKKKRGTTLLNYDEAKTNPKLRERFNNTPNAKRDNYADADFIKGGASAADRKAYAIKLANSTIKSGMSAADQAAIRKARKWYTGQTKGGKKAGWSDDSLKSIRRGDADKGKAGATTKAKTGTTVTLKAGTTTKLAAKPKPKPAPSASTTAKTRADGATAKATPARATRPAKTKGRVGAGTRPRANAEASAPRKETPATTPRKARPVTDSWKTSSGKQSKRPAAKKTGDSWKEQRAPKRLNKLQHATAQIAHDRVGDAKVKARRTKRQMASSERSGAASAAKSGSRFGNALAQGKEPEGFSPLTKRITNWIENPGEAPGKTKRPKVANPAFDKAAYQREQHHAATVAALAAHGYSEPMGKEKRKKLPGAGR